MSAELSFSETSLKKLPSRVSKACDQCSRYRRKCDGNTPCSLCVEKNRVCVYTRVVKKRGPEAQRLEKLRNEVLALTRKVQLTMTSTTGRNFNRVSHWTRKDFLKL